MIRSTRCKGVMKWVLEEEWEEEWEEEEWEEEEWEEEEW